MRVESSVTSVSWIPSEAVTGAVLKGTFDAKGVPTLIPYPDVSPLFSNPVTLTADHGPADDASSLKAYFNRGILATQALTHEVPISKKTGAPDAGALLKRIADPQDPLRKSLSSDLTTALPALPQALASSSLSQW